MVELGASGPVRIELADSKQEGLSWGSKWGGYELNCNYCAYHQVPVTTDNIFDNDRRGSCEIYSDSFVFNTIFNTA